MAFGYAAASIDCTAAAVLPFIIYLMTLGPSATRSWSEWFDGWFIDSDGHCYNHGRLGPTGHD